MKNRITPFAFVSLLALTLLTTACGESRKVQCNRIGGIVNSAGSKLLSRRGFDHVPKVSQEMVSRLKQAKLSDSKLKNLRTHIAKGYYDVGESAAAMGQYADERGYVVSTPETESVVQQYGKAMQHLSEVTKVTQSYCNGGSAPAKYTALPATI